MTQIRISEKSETTITLAVDASLFDDFDSEILNIEIDLAADDFDCEHDDCEIASGPSVSFLDWSPAQSVPTFCLSHQPQALIDFVATLS